MGYMKNSGDNGRVVGTFDDFTTEHVVGKFDYDKRDRSANDILAEEWRTDEKEWSDLEVKNDTDEIVREVTSEGEVREDE